VRSVVLGVDEVRDQADVVGAESRAFDQRLQVVPGVDELLGGVTRHVAGLEIDAADTGREEHFTGLHQIRRHRVCG
jgi:hypothetical protein